MPLKNFMIDFDRISNPCSFQEENGPRNLYDLIFFLIQLGARDKSLRIYVPLGE